MQELERQLKEKSERLEAYMRQETKELIDKVESEFNA